MEAMANKKVVEITRKASSGLKMKHNTILHTFGVSRKKGPSRNDLRAEVCRVIDVIMTHTKEWGTTAMMLVFEQNGKVQYVSLTEDGNLFEACREGTLMGIAVFDGYEKAEGVHFEWWHIIDTDDTEHELLSLIRQVDSFEEQADHITRAVETHYAAALEAEEDQERHDAAMREYVPMMLADGDHVPKASLIEYMNAARNDEEWYEQEAKIRTLRGRLPQWWKRTVVSATASAKIRAKYGVA